MQGYYIYIEDNKIDGCGIGARNCGNPNVIDVEVTEEVYNAYAEDRLRYVWNGEEIIENPNYEEITLINAKQAKYQEANDKAKEFIDSGNALYQFDEGKHIEATDGNIGKFTAYALAFVTGQLQPTDTVIWNTKEDENVELGQEDVVAILDGLGQVQARVWTVQFSGYVQQIENAATAEDVSEIEIDYTI